MDKTAYALPLSCHIIWKFLSMWWIIVKMSYKEKNSRRLHHLAKNQLKILKRKNAIKSFFVYQIISKMSVTIETKVENV